MRVIEPVSHTRGEVAAGGMYDTASRDQDAARSAAPAAVAGHASGPELPRAPTASRASSGDHSMISLFDDAYRDGDATVIRFHRISRSEGTATLAYGERQGGACELGNSIVSAPRSSIARAARKKSIPRMPPKRNP